MNLMVHWIISSCKITFFLQLWKRIELKHFFVGLLIFRKSTVGLRCCLIKKRKKIYCHWPPLPLVEEDVGLRIVIIHLPALSLNPNELLSDMNRALQKLSFGQKETLKGCHRARLAKGQYVEVRPPGAAGKIGGVEADGEDAEQQPAEFKPGNWQWLAMIGNAKP